MANTHEPKIKDLRYCAVSFFTICFLPLIYVVPFTLSLFHYYQRVSDAEVSFLLTSIAFIAWNLSGGLVLFIQKKWARLYAFTVSSSVALFCLRNLILFLLVLIRKEMFYEESWLSSAFELFCMGLYIFTSIEIWRNLHC